MAAEIVMPRLGWNMEKGSLGEWLKRNGDPVVAGETIFTVEGDKAVQEVEALDSGILFIPAESRPVGKDVPVGTLLAYILQLGETPPVQSTPSPAVEKAAGDFPLPVRKDALPGTGGPAISPRARRVARELSVDWLGMTGSGRTGRIVERDVRLAAARLPAATSDVRISPLAQRLAEQLGVDVQQLAAAASGRRIEREDVERAVRQALTGHVASTAAPARKALPLTPTRRTIAARMAESAQTAAAVTLTTEADASELWQLREAVKADGKQPVPSYTDLLARLVAIALTEHPHLNARLEGEAIVEAATVNIGLAVDTERGLLVPVLRDVQTKSLPQIANESADLIEKARSGRISVDELSGATFTITNLGPYEVDAFTPLINLPECAVLGVGRITPKPVVMDAATERIAVRRLVFLSLTFDHRLVDGAPAARFLQRVKQFVEKPYLWLIR